MKCIYKWVQLSDIHFQVREEKKAFNTKVLLSKLPEYLKNDIKKADALLLTGDYRYAPDKDENPTRVAEFIKRCADILHVDKNHIFVTPGNHDLNRNEIRQAVVDRAKKLYTADSGLIDPSLLWSLQDDFVFYKQLCQQLGVINYCGADNNPHTIVDAGLVSFLMLNTALVACGKEDFGSLIVGSSLVQARVSQGGKKPIIAIGHHGLDWLLPDENRACTKFFDNNGINLYLCGHSHNHWTSQFGEKGKQVSVGCFMQGDKTVYAGFSVGEIYENGSINVHTHKWDMGQQCWCEDLVNNRDSLVSVSLDAVGGSETSAEIIQKKEFPFSVEGFHLLGSLGVDGIKYYWKKDNEFVESLAFNKSSRYLAGDFQETNTSSYTISTSIGCQLSANNRQCSFCGTGLRSYVTNLAAEEIALQSIFMAEYDSNCTSFQELKNNLREFAFMGQGEPGFNYSAVREAILLNDYVMKRIGQTVSRYIICTSGVTDFLPSLTEDVRRGVFVHPITIHFSLNAIGSDRDQLMPINRMYDYRAFLEQCKIYYQVTKRKISIGLLMFREYPLGSGEKYSLSKDKLEGILNQLDADAFRIDLCAVNKICADIQNKKLSNEIANELLDIVKQKGFEGKIFYSIGDSDNSGCGMLNSNHDGMEAPGGTTIRHFNKAIELLEEAKKYRKNELYGSVQMF